MRSLTEVRDPDESAGWCTRRRQMQEGGGEEALQQGAACLQSFPRSGDSAVAQPPGPAQSQHQDVANEPASAPCCARASMRMNIRLRSHVCQASSCAFNLYIRSVWFLGNRQASPAQFQMLRPRKTPENTRLKHDGTYMPTPCTGQPLSNTEHTWVYVTYMMRPLPWG